MSAISGDKLDWVDFYTKFADKLFAYKSNRVELLSILRTAHEQAGLKYQFNDFKDIDPFTVFGAFNKGNNTRRMTLIKVLTELMDIKTAQPTNFDGIPVLVMAGIVAQNTEDVDDVWSLFDTAINYADNPTENNRNSFVKCYNTVSKHKGISWNITMGLFWMRPYFYLSLDGTNRSFLLNNDVHSIRIENISRLKQVPDAETYLRIIEICRSKFSDGDIAFHSFPELSRVAWLTSTTHKQDKISEAKFLQWFEPIIEALKNLGGSASPEAVRNQIIINLNLPDETVNETRGKTGVKKFDNDVAFARSYLVNEGIIDNSVRGVWTLTEKGKNITMTHELASEIFSKWVDILKEPPEGASDDAIEERESSEKHFWLYAPGGRSSKWDEFYSQSVMGIGWDEMGDLTQYSDKEAMRIRMKELYDDSVSHKHSSLATWQFVHAMREGDIVFVKKGMRYIVGRGIVESEYIFMPEREEYKHIRRIKWTHNGNWEHPGLAVTKFLTDITNYTDYVQKLEMLITGDEDLDEHEPVEISYDEYSEDNFISDVFIERSQYEILVNLLKNKKNLILQGAPGVGKTFAAKRLAYSIIGKWDTSRVMIVQFHQSYSYEDFIMGFRPTKDGFELAQGPFYTFCKNAEDDLEREYFFIIDEINRGNLSKIFGELLMLIENDKRGEKLRLLYSNELFSVPKNVYIIGLMNTADRSLAMIDYALRRRFAFYEMAPAFDSSGFTMLIERSNNDKFAVLIERVKELNEAISKDESLGDGFKIGHGYFCTKDEITDYWLTSIINYEIIPLLNEYWFDDKSKIEIWKKKLHGVLND